MPPVPARLVRIRIFLTLWKDADPGIPILKQKQNTRSSSHELSATVSVDGS
jgi:hypothetical protein